MTIFNRIRTLALSVLTASLLVAPACDDGSDYEALGVSVEDLETMSDEELEALDRELELGNGRLVTHEPHSRPEDVEELRNPIVFTHAERPNHVTKLGNRPRPTHDSGEPAPGALAADADEPPSCDTHGDDDLEIAAR